MANTTFTVRTVRDSGDALEMHTGGTRWLAVGGVARNSLPAQRVSKIIYFYICYMLILIFDSIMSSNFNCEL